MFGTLALSPILLRIASTVAVVGAILFGGWYIHHTGYKSGYSIAEAKVTTQFNQYKEAQQLAFDKAIAETRKTEADLQAKLLQSLAEKEIEIKNINDTHKRINDSLRNRPSRSSAPAAKSGSTDSPTAQCSGAVGDGTGLSREDAEFLVGEAAAADTLRKALQFCREAYQRLLEPKEDKTKE